MTYWIGLSEVSHELELSIDGTPPMIEGLDVEFDNGVAVAGALPVIDVPVVIAPQERLTDNIPAYGCKGLLINAWLKDLLTRFGIVNVDYYPARLIDQRSADVMEPFWIANVIGRFSCIDRVKSDLEYYADGDIQFINALALLPLDERVHGHIFRAAEFLPVLVVSDALKSWLEQHGVTGLRFYAPAEFSL